MSSRSVPIFVSIQVAASGLSAVLWAILGHVGSVTYVATAQSVLAVGQASHLCLSLGLPTILPNQARKAESLQEPRVYAAPVVLLSLICSLVLGLSVVALGLQFAFSGASTIPLSGALAAFLVSSLTLQQLGRIQSSSMLYTAAVMMGPVIPVIWIVMALLFGGLGGLEYLFVGVGLSVLCVVLVSRMLLFARSLDPSISLLVCIRESRSALRVSTPLIVHLSAYGVLTQGVRLTAAMRRLPSTGIVTAGYMMLLFTISTTLVGGTNGVLGVDIQTAHKDALRAVLGRAAKIYTAVGVAAGVVIAIVVSVPWVSTIFPGFIPATNYGFLFVLLSVALAGYFLNSSLVLRAERTASLSLISASVLVICLAASFMVSPTNASLLLVFTLAFMGLHCLTALLSIKSLPGFRRSIACANSWILLGYILGACAGAVRCLALKY